MMAFGDTVLVMYCMPFVTTWNSLEPSVEYGKILWSRVLLRDALRRR